MQAGQYHAFLLGCIGSRQIVAIEDEILRQQRISTGNKEALLKVLRPDSPSLIVNTPVGEHLGIDGEGMRTLTLGETTVRFVSTPAARGRSGMVSE